MQSCVRQAKREGCSRQRNIAEEGVIKSKWGRIFPGKASGRRVCMGGLMDEWSSCADQVRKEVFLAEGTHVETQ